MAIPTPYNIGALEGAGVSGAGAFIAALAAAMASGAITTGGVESAIIAGAGAFLAFLGYHAYQNS